ncbi:MAG: efflux RND transporter periplasmic adaptor subunit [Desulfomonile sp.]|nr:efflux RND transporter periplasmic adaptor subunit [Deltaproteobacteria bacterium]
MKARGSLSRLIVVGGILTLLSWMGSGLRVTAQAQDKSKVSPSQQAQKTARAEIVRTHGEITVSGTVVAKQGAVISARISGYITDLMVNAGDSVKAGDDLMRIDTKELAQKEAEAAAALESAKADFANAKRDFERYGPLFESKAVSKQQYDEVGRKYEVAQATYQRAQATLDQTRTQLSYGDIKAPFDGMIADRTVNVGDLAMPGRQLLTIYVPGTLELVAPVAEQYSRYVKPGTHVDVTIPSIELNQATSLREVVPQTNEQTKTITVKAPLADAMGLVPGVYGTLTFATTSSEVIAIPSNAIRVFGQLETVKVLRDGRIESRYVRTGRKLDHEKVEILSGLDPGEEVVINLEAGNL